jgi:hypothetical protein
MGQHVMIANVTSWRGRSGPALATASLLAGLLITGVWLYIVARASFKTADQRLIALGDVFAGGIFLLALIAGILSVIAYVGSSRRPHLQTSWQFVWRDGTISSTEIPLDQGHPPRKLAGALPPGVSGTAIPLEPVTLTVRMLNDGEVVAMNVTVAFFLEGIFFDPPPAPEPHSQWRIQCRNRTYGWWQIHWEGRTDLPIYAGDLPRTVDIELTGMWAAAPEIPRTGWGEVVTLADALKKPQHQPLMITIARSHPG